MVTFEWDEDKRANNITKHDIDFIDIQEMFEGPMLVATDMKKEYGENRKIGFGLVRGRLMAVVFTERGADTIRIISARKANHREEAHFKKTLGDQLGPI